MIPKEEADGLLAEADHAETTGANGGMVLLTPEYTRYIIGLLGATETVILEGDSRMSLYRKKPVVVEAITFDELVEHGRQSSPNLVNGMPWSFDYKGHPITHENDECYLIPTLEGMMKFTPDDMLITGVKGEIYPCKSDIFAATYEPA